MKKLKTTLQVMNEFDDLVLDDYETGLGEVSETSDAIQEALDNGLDYLDIDESMTKSGKVERIDLFLTFSDE